MALAKSAHVQVIEIPVSDVAASVAWYRRLFDLDFTLPYQEGDEEAWMVINGLGLGLIQTDLPAQTAFTCRSGAVKPFVTFEVRDVERLHAELARQGDAVSPLTYKQGGGNAFHLTDPSGNLINLWGGFPPGGDTRLKG